MIFYIEIAIIIILILLNGIFAMSELAIVSSKKVRLKRLAEEGSQSAAQALEFSENTEKFLPSVQIGITLIGVLAGAFGGAAFADPLTDYLVDLGISHDTSEIISVGTMVVLITYVTLIIGELVPKELALRNPERCALIAAPIVGFVSKIAWPMVWLLKKSCTLVLFVIRAKEKPESTVTQEEIEALIAEGAKHGVFEKKEKDMLAGVMLLADKPVRAFMVPRIDVVSLDINTPAEEIKSIISQHPYSRFPVRAADDEHEIVGVVETKDILSSLLQGDHLDLHRLTKQVKIFTDDTSALKIIESLRRMPTHAAIVTDHNGSFQGIITLVDLFSIISGEFHEHDKEADIIKRDDGSWFIDGGTLIERAFKKIGLRAKPQGNFHTLAGFILQHSQKVPKTGDVLEFKNFKFEIADMDGYRIDKILVTKKESKESKKPKKPKLPQKNKP